MINIILYKLWVNYLETRQAESFSDKFIDVNSTRLCHILLARGSSNIQVDIEQSVMKANHMHRCNQCA